MNTIVCLYFYNFDVERPEELLAILAQNLQKRRLEKGLSREALTELSGVPTPTIAKFEQKHTISLASYVALAKALGYSKAIKELLSEPLFSTMEELEMINKNKNRKKGVMKSVNKLIVTYHNRNVGTLSMTPDNRLCAFQYEKKRK